MANVNPPVAVMKWLPPEAELLDIAEVARCLRVKESTVRSWRYKGTVLPFVKISGRIVVRRVDVEALIRDNIKAPHVVRGVQRAEEKKNEEVA